MLKMSYCDHAVSVVRASSVVRRQHLPCSLSRSQGFSSIFMNVCLDDISVSFEFGSCRVKTWSLGQISLKPCSPSRGHRFAPIFMNFARMFVWMIPRSSSNMGYVGSKTRSLVHFLNLVHPLEATVLLQSS